jgi:DNA-binding NtrC family response regulator
MLQIPGFGAAAGEVSDLIAEVRRIQDRGIPEGGIEFEDLVSSLERYLIRMASEKAGGNQSQTARYLHLNRDKLRTRMKNHHLPRA